MTNNKRAFTFMELIMTMVLSGVILLGVSQLIISHARFSTTLQAKNALSQEVAAVVEDISAKVRNSKYVDLSKVNDANPELGLYGLGDNNKTGTYKWSGNNLDYIDSGGNSRLVSNKLSNLIFANALPGGGMQATKLVKITVGVQDPKYPDAGSKAVTTTAYCHIKGAPHPVRVVHNSNGQTDMYDTIQAAIDAPTTISGDTVQVSSNDGIVYKEKVTITNKNVSVLGTYDYNSWTRHATGYETIIDGTGLASQGGLINFSSNTGNAQGLTIDGFTLRNNPSGPAISVTSSNVPITISNNLITKNNASFASPSTAIVIDNSSYIGSGTYDGILITHNNIMENLGSTGGIGFVCSGFYDGQISIYNNKITNNPNSGIWMHVANETSIFFSINNNEIRGNGNITSSLGGGIHISGSGSIEISPVLFQIYNNLISGNKALMGGGIYVNEKSTHYTLAANTIVYNTITNNSISENNFGSAIYCDINAVYVSDNTITQHYSGRAVVYINDQDSHPRDTTTFGSIINRNLLKDNQEGCPLYIVASGEEHDCLIESNEVRSNRSSTYAGIRIEAYNKAIIKVNNNLIAENNSTAIGSFSSGLDLYCGTVNASGYYTIEAKNNTIARNGLTSGGALTGGIYFQNYAAVNPVGTSVIYTISYLNVPNSLYRYPDHENALDITYSDIEGYGGQQASHNLRPPEDPGFIGGNPYNYTPTNPHCDLSYGQTTIRMGESGVINTGRLPSYDSNGATDYCVVNKLGTVDW